MLLVRDPLLRTFPLGLEVVWVLMSWPPTRIFITTWDPPGHLSSFLSNASLRWRWEAGVRV